jgi:hypothetical protein
MRDIEFGVPARHLVFVNADAAEISIRSQLSAAARAMLPMSSVLWRRTGPGRRAGTRAVTSRRPEVVGNRVVSDTEKRRYRSRF